MKKLLYGLAVLPFVAGSALARQPVQLDAQQMDRVTAGMLEIINTNTAAVAVSIWQTGSLLQSTPNNIQCGNCYLLINSSVLSVASEFGPGFSPGTIFPP